MSSKHPNDHATKLPPDGPNPPYPPDPPDSNSPYENDSPFVDEKDMKPGRRETLDRVLDKAKSDLAKHQRPK